jgi:hypothetical protein
MGSGLSRTRSTILPTRLAVSSPSAVNSSKSLEQEIVMLLDILNYEIYQAAACIADLLESQSQLPLKAALQCLGPFN